MSTAMPVVIDTNVFVAAGFNPKSHSTHILEAVLVTVAVLDGNVVTGAGARGAPHVKVFRLSDGAEQASFFAGPGDDRGGVRVAVRDLAADGRPEVVALAAGVSRAYDPLTGADGSDQFDPAALAGVFVV